MSVEERINEMRQYKNLLEQDPENDFFLFPFMNLALKIVEEKGFLTEKGLQLLHQDITDVMAKVIEGCGNKDKVRASLYFCIAYNITTIFACFVKSLDEDDCPFKDTISDEDKNFLKSVMDRSIKIAPVMKKILDSELPKLSDKYAQIFDNEKRQAFIKAIFHQEPIHIINPELPDNLDKAMEVKP